MACKSGDSRRRTGVVASSMYGWAAAAAVMSGQAFGRQQHAPTLLCAARGGWWPRHEPGHALATQDPPMADMSSACGKEPLIFVVSAPHGHGRDPTSSPPPRSTAQRWNLGTGDSRTPAMTAAKGTLALRNPTVACLGRQVACSVDVAPRHRARATKWWCRMRAQAKRWQ